MVRSAATALFRRHTGVLAIVALALAAASVVAPIGWNQASHYALVRALDEGTPYIDALQASTGDKGFYDGHWYSARAPGTAFVALPAYRVIEAAGLTGYPVWLIGLWAAVLPALGMMLLVRWMADRLEPGYGTAAAITLGLATLLLPFSTMLFSHVLAAFLGFAAFALLWRERERGGPERLWVLALAGAVAGYGITTEYPLLFTAIVLGVYVLWPDARQRPARAVARGASYAGGVALGVLPLALFNLWAYGSATHVAYADIPDNKAGFFGIHLPNPAVSVELLLSSRGLLILTPIVIMGVAGTVLLHRRGRRAEAVVIAAIAAIYLTYNSGYWLPYGGESPGPRFLITMLPFLAVPLALAFRRMPLPTLALAVVSATCMVVATLTQPLIDSEGQTGAWMERLEGNDLQASVLTIAGDVRGAAAFIPFLVLVAAAVALAWATTPRSRVDVAALRTALLVTVGWALVAILAPGALGIDDAAEERVARATDSATQQAPFGQWPIAHLVLLAAALAVVTVTVAARRALSRPALGG